MTITSLTFFLFLPVVLAAYYLCRVEIREYVLLGASLVFYACGQLSSLMLLLISIGVTLLDGWLIGKYQKNKNQKNKKICTALLTAGIVYHLTALCCYKYAGAIFADIMHLTGEIALR